MAGNGDTGADYLLPVQSGFPDNSLDTVNQFLGDLFCQLAAVKFSGTFDKISFQVCKTDNQGLLGKFCANAVKSS